MGTDVIQVRTISVDNNVYVRKEDVKSLLMELAAGEENGVGHRIQNYAMVFGSLSSNNEYRTGKGDKLKKRKFISSGGCRWELE